MRDSEKKDLAKKVEEAIKHVHHGGPAPTRKEKVEPRKKTTKVKKSWWEIWK